MTHLVALLHHKFSKYDRFHRIDLSSYKNYHKNMKYPKLFLKLMQSSNLPRLFLGKCGYLRAQITKTIFRHLDFIENQFFPIYRHF